MDKLRIRFEKTGKSIYISHLDMMRVAQRIFLRAKTPLRYSEGFNPHALISIGLPLSVGCASRCELMDFRVVEDIDLDALPEQLNAVSPEGIRFLEAYEPERKASGVKWLRVGGVLDYDERDPEDMAIELMQFFSQESVLVTRRTKRGEGILDLAPNIDELYVEPDVGGVILEAVISAQEPTVNPELLIAALRQNAPEIAPEFAKFTRLEVYDSEMELFK